MSENKEDSARFDDSDGDRLDVNWLNSQLDILLAELKKDGFFDDINEEAANNTASELPLDASAEEDVDEDDYLYGNNKKNELVFQTQTQATNTLSDNFENSNTPNTNPKEKEHQAVPDNVPDRKLLLDILEDNKEESLKEDNVLKQLKKMCSEVDRPTVEKGKLEESLETNHQGLTQTSNEDGSQNLAATLSNQDNMPTKEEGELEESLEDTQKGFTQLSNEDCSQSLTTTLSNLLSSIQEFVQCKQSSMNTNEINGEQIMERLKKKIKQYSKKEIKKLYNVHKSRSKLRGKNSSAIPVNEYPEAYKPSHDHYSVKKYRTSSSERSPSPRRKRGRSSSSCSSYDRRSRHKTQKRSKSRSSSSSSQYSQKSKKETRRRASRSSQKHYKNRKRSTSRSSASSYETYRKHKQYNRRKSRSRLSSPSSSSSFDTRRDRRCDKYKKRSRSRSRSSLTRKASPSYNYLNLTSSHSSCKQHQNNNFPASSSTYVTQKTFHQEMSDGNSIIRRKATVTTSYTEELQSLVKSVKNNKGSSKYKRDDSLERLDLVVLDSASEDVTLDRPSGDFNHPFYIHPEDIEFYKVRTSNNTPPVQAFHELCVKYKWGFPTYLNLHAEQGRFRFGMKLKDHLFFTNKVGQQKKLARAELARAVLQWLRIIDIV